MKSTYPESLNMWLKDFPKSFQLVCGKKFNDLPGPWQHGSRINFAATPLSKQDQGDYANGEQLPIKRAIYTNTGDEDTWDIRVNMYGHGTFYALAGEPYYFMQAEKYFLIESVYFDPVQFFHNEVHITEISTDIPIPDVYVPADPPEDRPERDPDKPPADPPKDPEKPKPGDPTKLKNHSEFLYWTIMLNLTELDVDVWWMGITTLSVPPVRATVQNLTYDDLFQAIKSHGLQICSWQGLRYVLMKNWLGPGLLNWFFRENPPGSGEWRAEWLFIYYSVVYNDEEIIHKIRRLT
jgi:hypothetical protein